MTGDMKAPDAKPTTIGPNSIQLLNADVTVPKRCALHSVVRRQSLSPAPGKGMLIP